MRRQEEWPSSTESGLQVCLLHMAPVLRNGEPGPSLLTLRLKTSEPFRGGNDRNCAKRMEREQIRIPGKDKIGSPIHSKFQKLVVPGIATPEHRPENENRLSDKGKLCQKPLSGPMRDVAFEFRPPKLGQFHHRGFRDQDRVEFHRDTHGAIWNGARHHQMAHQRVGVNLDKLDKLAKLDSRELPKAKPRPWARPQTSSTQSPA
jgi:hypothetical protein